MEQNMFVADYIINGTNGLEGHGEVGQLMANVGGAFENVRFDAGLMRPYIDDDPNSPMRGRPCVTVNTGVPYIDEKTGKQRWKKKKMLISELQARGVNSPVFNTTHLLRQAWVHLDQRIVMATRTRLQAWAYLNARVPYGGFDGMSVMTHEYDFADDAGEAVVDMDAQVPGRMSDPLYGTASIPLPITHYDFDYSERLLAVHRRSGRPLPTVHGERAGRRIGEKIEDTTIGVETGITFGTRSTGPDPHRGTSVVQGMTNFTYRVTKTDLTTPAGTNPEAVLQDLIEMRETMYTNGFFGPFVVFHSTPYSQWLDSDYFRSGSTSAVRSLRERIAELGGIELVRLDRLTTGYQLIMIQVDSETVEMITGMEETIIQWPSLGGLRQNFKVLAIKVPLFKAPYNGVAGVQHATTA
jgi:hypothetical protein